MAYVFSTPAVRLLITMVFVIEAFGWAHETILPVMARDVLNAGALGLGASGIPSFLAEAYLAYSETHELNLADPTTVGMLALVFTSECVIMCAIGARFLHMGQRNGALDERDRQRWHNDE